MTDCIFCRIARGEIPADIVYSDDQMVIFRDIQPVAPIHLLLISREHFANFGEATAAQAQRVGQFLGRLAELAPSLGLADGYRLVINQGAIAGQTVFHLHIHILGGVQMSQILPQHNQ